MNQQVDLGVWKSLGSYLISGDGSGSVVLTDQANGEVVADAVRLTADTSAVRSATWTYSAAVSGDYRVFARWPAAEGNATNARYTVQHAGGSSIVSVSQAQRGGQWNELGVFGFSGGQDYAISLSDDANGTVMADALYIVKVEEVSDAVTWAPALPASGTYQVYAKWTSDETRATDARYSIVHEGGTAEVTRNQRVGGGLWHYLGPYAFDPLNTPMVTLAANDNGSVAADAVRFVGGPGGATEIVYLHSDHLGTPQAMTDANAQVLWWRDQTPFGQTVAEGGFSVSPLRFPGQYADAESGLNYNYFRDYDPALGRYIQSDPIGLRGGLNTYGYVGGNPLNRTDPFGLVEFFTYELNGEETSNLRCECGETFQAFSGAAGEPRNNPAFANSKDKGPLPKGRYYIVDRPTGGRLGWAYAWFRGDWFGLYRDDGIFDDYTNIDGVIRGNFRLHPGGRSEGCLTLVNDEQFELLRQLLENTEPGFIPSAGNIPYYGIVDVISPGTQVMPEGL